MSIAIPKLKGSNVFIRTVTHYFTGRVERVTKSWIILSQAAWIADTGRFSEALKTGELNEVEPYPDDGIVRVSRDGVIDVTPWTHSLPREMK